LLWTVGRKIKKTSRALAKFVTFKAGWNKRKGKRTVDDPTFDFGRGHLQYGGYVCVRQVLPDVLEAEICEG
jgi:hypothetical protein